MISDNNSSLRRAGAVEIHIRKLAYSARDKTNTAFQMSQWVLNNLEIDWLDIAPDDAPSSGAVALLREAKANDRGRGFFLKEFVAKTMPTRTEVMEIDRSTDDNATDIELLESFKSTVTEADRSALRWNAEQYGQG